MGLILIGGYYDKEKALKVLRGMKYYNRDLSPIESEQPKGLIAMINAQEEKNHEDYLVEKLITVRNILQQEDDDAIDSWQELTSPNENDTLLQPLKRFFPEDKMLCEMLDELSIPMKKDEFDHYLSIYNEFYN